MDKLKTIINIILIQIYFLFLFGFIWIEKQIFFTGEPYNELVKKDPLSFYKMSAVVFIVFSFLAYLTYIFIKKKNYKNLVFILLLYYGLFLWFWTG